MRAKNGFTLIELVVVVAIVAVLATIVVWQGRSAGQAAGLAGGAYDLALRIGRVKARAMADGRDYLLVLTDASNPAACARQRTLCGRALMLRDPQPGFAITGFNPAPPIAGAEWIEEEILPVNSQFDLASTWRAPVPFNAVQAWDPAIRATCAGGVACFALRFGADGEVRPVLPGAPASPAGFAFVLRPVTASSAAAERRALFVSFPSGIVKTAAF